MRRSIRHELDRANARRHLLQDDLELEPRDMGARAQMRPEAERDMPVRGPVENEPRGCGKRVLVAVGGSESQCDHLSAADDYAAQLHVTRCVARLERHWRASLRNSSTASGISAGWSRRR